MPAEANHFIQSCASRIGSILLAPLRSEIFGSANFVLIGMVSDGQALYGHIQIRKLLSDNDLTPPIEN